jgi:hypothetical protein
MPNPSKTGSSRPSDSDNTKQGQPRYQPVEQSLDAELEEAQREEDKVRNPSIEEPEKGDGNTSPVQVSGEDFGDESGEIDVEDQDAGQAPGNRDPNESQKSKRGGDRLRP